MVVACLFLGDRFLASCYGIYVQFLEFSFQHSWLIFKNKSREKTGKFHTYIMVAGENTKFKKSKPT